MDTKEFEQLLLQERDEIEQTLKTVSKRNPENPNDWEPNYPDLNVDTADKSEFADEVEGFDTNIGVNAVLEDRYHEVVSALERIQNGTYGVCEKGKEQIGLDRLRANPSARTCVEHSK